MMRRLLFWIFAAAMASALAQEAPAPVAEQSRPPGALRMDLLKRSRDVGTVAEAFGTKSWVPVPKPVPPPPVVVEEPRAPPLPFRYMGQVDDGRGNRTFFLLRGTATLSVAVGETIDNTYRLESAETGVLHFTYLPLRTRQSFQFGVGP